MASKIKEIEEEAHKLPSHERVQLAEQEMLEAARFHESQTIVIIAVAHLRRRPWYWRKRI